MNLRLVEPTPSHESAVIYYRDTFNDEHIPGGGLVQEFEYGDWLSRNEQLKTKPPADLVKSLQYLAIDEQGNLVGMIQLRLALNDYLENYGGHIGYSVHPEHRQKGYATEMLKLSLVVARQHWLPRILVTCDQDNQASAKVILKCGGKYEDSRLEPGAKVPTDRYWIDTEL